jgi:hypothetical protein
VGWTHLPEKEEDEGEEEDTHVAGSLNKATKIPIT